MFELDACELACKFAGIAPLGTEWQGSEPLTCSLTGVAILPGQLAAPFLPSTGFTDEVSLVTRSGVVSGWTAPFLTVGVMTKTQSAIFCSEGVFSLSKDSDRAWLLTTPPTPPWVAVISDSMRQHLVWRTPVTLDNRIMRIRLGKERVLTVNHESVKRALDAIAEQRVIDPTFRHGFLALDRELKDPNHGVIRDDCPPTLRALYQTLSAGEVWALAILAKATPPIPQIPTLLF